MMRTFPGAAALSLAFVIATGSAAAPDITGTWSASFDTQIGRQDYTYQFQVKGSLLTGKASSANGESDILNGKVDGEKVTFLENFTYQGMTIPITYAGSIASVDEIKFTRRVAQFASEALVAHRVKP